MVQQAIAHVASIHIQELPVRACAVHRGQPEQPAQRQRTGPTVEDAMGALVFVAERRQRAGLPGRRRPGVAAAAVDPEGEADSGVRQCDASPGIQAVRRLGPVRLQELAPCRRTRVEIQDFDRRAPGAGGRFDARRCAVEHVGVWFVGGPAGDPHARHRRDRRQRFATEAERFDAFEFRERTDLAGGMALQRQCEFVCRNAATVVGHQDAAYAALLDAQFDRSGARIDRILEQFLDDRCRPLDDLAGRDLADQDVGERLDRPPPECRSTGRVIGMILAAGIDRARVARRFRAFRRTRERHRLVGRGGGCGHAGRL